VAIGYKRVFLRCCLSSSSPKWLTSHFALSFQNEDEHFVHDCAVYILLHCEMSIRLDRSRVFCECSSGQRIVGFQCVFFARFHQT